MDSFFSDIGIRAVDFVYISAVFVTTMAGFFGLKKKHMWLSYLMTGTFAVICLTTILFRPESNLRLFAALMLLSVITIEVAVTWIRERGAANYPEHDATPFELTEATGTSSQKKRRS